MLRSAFFRRRRLPIALILLLLFSQFATAAYACPNAATQEQRSGSEMADCEGAGGAAAMDPEQPLLCKASCEDAAQNSGTFAAADLTHASALLLYVLPPASALDQDRGLPADVLPSPGHPPPGWPPLYLFHRVLRN